MAGETALRDFQQLLLEIHRMHPLILRAVSTAAGLLISSLIVRR